MSKRDIFESVLATIIILTYAYLVIIGKASVEGFVAIAVYVIKKYLDGIDEVRRNGVNKQNGGV